MSLPRLARFLVPLTAGAVVVFAIGCTTVAQEDGGMAGPPPAPELALLKATEGVWDAKVTMHMAPGVPPEESKGTETVRMSCGGLWAISDFKGDMMGMPFEGHGVSGYDPEKKKYVHLWVDGWTTALHPGEGTASADKKTLTILRQAPDMSGALVAYREVAEMKDADHRTFSLYHPGPDGKEALAMKIEYTRKK
jgi:hypothetical protein